jgi:predicted Zn-dependent peptidase
VVCEEFKEHYLNKPYGDAWMIMRELAYKVHPYRWMTIGRQLSHIEEARLADVKSFFHRHYNPANAILVVAGNVYVDQARALAEKWFGGIPSGERYHRNLPQEPLQTEARRMEVRANVPLDAFYKSWHMGARNENRYYAADLLTDMLGGGTSSRLYESLVKDKKLFSSIECYHFGSLDNGLLNIEGKIVKGVDIRKAEEAVDHELAKMSSAPVDAKELEKVKNKTESMMAFEDMNVMNRAASLAFYELLGDASLIDTELEKYRSVTADEILEECRKIFREENSNTLHYLADEKS